MGRMDRQGLKQAVVMSVAKANFDMFFHSPGPPTFVTPPAQTWQKRGHK